jgi:hypothetical protein
LSLVKSLTVWTLSKRLNLSVPHPVPPEQKSRLSTPVNCNCASPAALSLLYIYCVVNHVYSDLWLVPCLVSRYLTVPLPLPLATATAWLLTYFPGPNVLSAHVNFRRAAFHLPFSIFHFPFLNFQPAAISAESYRFRRGGWRLTHRYVLRASLSAAVGEHAFYVPEHQSQGILTHKHTPWI